MKIGSTPQKWAILKYFRHWKAIRALVTRTFLCNFPPKLGFDVQFVHTLNQTTNVVTEYFTESFIDLRRLGLAPQTVTELCFDHGERRFDVALFVVLLHEPVLIVLIVEVHPTPEGCSCCALPGRCSPRVGFKTSAHGQSRDAVHSVQVQQHRK